MSSQFFRILSLTCVLVFLIQANEARAHDLFERTIANFLKNVTGTDHSFVRVTFLEDDKPFAEQLAEVTPKFSKNLNYHVLEVRVPTGGLKNPFIIQDIINELGAYNLYRNYRGEFSFELRKFEIGRELWFEAANGNATAALNQTQKRLARIGKENLTYSLAANSDLMKWASDYFQMRKMPPPSGATDYFSLLASIQEQERLRLQKTIESLEQKAKAEHRAAQKDWESQKRTLKLMEKISEDKKLNDLVKANDRKGVRQMIEAFLPWPLMGLMEREAWKIWLEAIEKPNPDNSRVLFRGLDPNDLPQETTYQGKRSLGLFSTILTRNQGNYNRRLLSLATKRSESRSDLSSLFLNHSVKPVASQFISFSTVPAVAASFTEFNQELVIAKIDRRRAIVNALGVHNEAEVLVPLVVFPDEVISIHKRTDASNLLLLEVDAAVESLNLKNDVGPRYGEGLFRASTKFFGEIAVRAYRQIRLNRAPEDSCRRIFGIKK